MRASILVALLGCGGDPRPVPDAACQPAVLYLNRDGGDYDAGPFDDSSANRSVLLDGPISLARYPHDDVTWANIIACIRGGLGPFPVDIVERDPGALPHVEIVFTTSYWAGPAGTTHVIPDSCRPGHELVFVFGDALPTDARACQMALIGYAQLTAQLSIGDNCLDFLDLSADCAPERAFVDEEVPCVDGLGQPIACRCGGTTQNTFAALSAAIPRCD